MWKYYDKGKSLYNNRSKQRIKKRLNSQLTKALLATTRFSTCWAKAYLKTTSTTRPDTTTTTSWAREEIRPETVRSAPPNLTRIAAAGPWIMPTTTAKCFQSERADT